MSVKSKSPFSISAIQFLLSWKLFYEQKLEGAAQIHVEHQFDHDRATSAPTLPYPVSHIYLSGWQARSAKTKHLPDIC